METVSVVARVVLAATFLLAAWAKARDLPGTARTLEAFGVPAAASPAAAPVLPAVEVALGALLLLAGGPSPGVAAVVVLAVFTAALGRALASGEPVACHCFGQASDEPVSPASLGRNAGLAGLGVLAALHGTAAVSWPDGDVLRWLLLAVLASGTAAVTLLWPSARLRLLRRRGAPLPRVALVSPDGEVPARRALDVGGPAVAVFIGPGCGPCEDLVPELRRWREVLRDRLDVEVVVTGERDEANADSPVWQVGDHHLDPQGQALVRLGVPGTPGAVELLPGGRHAEPVAGVLAVEALLRRLAAQPPRRAARSARTAAGSLTAARTGRTR